MVAADGVALVYHSKTVPEGKLLAVIVDKSTVLAGHTLVLEEIPNVGELVPALQQEFTVAVKLLVGL